MTAETNETMDVLHVQPGTPICAPLARILARHNRIRQHTKLWYTTRTRMLTASDAASVLGLNPYSSRKQVFLKKTGQSRPFKGNFATRRGNRLEAVALAAYEKKTGKTAWNEDIGLLQHADYPTLGGSPDGITVDGVLIEIKCPLTRKIVPGQVPKHYMPQVQFLLEVFDLETAHFVQYKPAERNQPEVLDVAVVQRDRATFARWLPSLLGFMQDVFDFYDKAKLPVGTPMIDWDAVDAKAAAKLEADTAVGIGKVCAFVDDPITNKSLFVMEEYNGPTKPVIRTEHELIESAVEQAKSAHEAVVEDDDGTAEMDRILSQLPDELRSEISASANRQSGDESEEDNDGTFIDIEAVEARMRAEGLVY